MHERTAPHYGLTVAAALLAVLATGCAQPPTLEGRIQKVRIYPGEDSTCVIVVDFRATNPSRYPFLVKNAALELETAAGTVVTGAVASDGDAARYLELNPAQGPKYNPSLVVRDRIAPGQTVDRMLAANFEIPEKEAVTRRSIRIRVLDADGPVAVLTP